MPSYRVLLKDDMGLSKTVHLEAENVENIKNFYSLVSALEVVEILEVKYYNQSFKSNKTTIPLIKVLCKNKDNESLEIPIHHFLRSCSNQKLEKAIVDNLLVNGKKINSIILF